MEWRWISMVANRWSNDLVATYYRSCLSWFIEIFENKCNSWGSSSFVAVKIKRFIFNCSTTLHTNFGKRFWGPKRFFGQNSRYGCVGTAASCFWGGGDFWCRIEGRVSQFWRFALPPRFLLFPLLSNEFWEFVLAVEFYSCWFSILFFTGWCSLYQCAVQSVTCW